MDVVKSQLASVIGQSDNFGFGLTILENHSIEISMNRLITASF